MFGTHRVNRALHLERVRDQIVSYISEICTISKLLRQDTLVDLNNANMPLLTSETSAYIARFSIGGADGSKLLAVSVDETMSSKSLIESFSFTVDF